MEMIHTHEIVDVDGATRVRQAHRMHGMVHGDLRHHFALVPEQTTGGSHIVSPLEGYSVAEFVKELPLERQITGMLEERELEHYITTMALCALWAGESKYSVQHVLSAPEKGWPRAWRIALSACDASPRVLQKYVNCLPVASALLRANGCKKREGEDVLSAVLSKAQEGGDFSSLLSAYRLTGNCDGGIRFFAPSLMQDIIKTVRPWNDRRSFPKTVLHTKSIITHHAMHGEPFYFATANVALRECAAAEAAGLWLQVLAIACELDHHGATALMNLEAIRVHRVADLRPEEEREGEVPLHKFVYKLRSPERSGAFMRIAFLSPFVCILDMPYAAANPRHSSISDLIRESRVLGVKSSRPTPQNLMYHAARHFSSVSLTVDGMLDAESHGIHHDLLDTCETGFNGVTSAEVPGEEEEYVHTSSMHMEPPFLVK